MSKIEVNTVAPQCGTTLTLGESGDTVTLGSGASQSGFGRQGSVNWQTSIKTATFTAVSGEGYFCDTASVGAFTVNLPSSPSVGDIVAIKDYASNFATANLTIGRGGSNLNGTAADSTRNTNNESLTLVYADATKGWLSVEEGTGFVGEQFMVATGGTESTCGNFKIHTFTGPGTFDVTQTASAPACNAVEYIVTAGGGGAGRPNQSGGGGGGGFRFASPTLAPATYPGKPLAAPAGTPVSVQAYPITVGGGGAAGVGSNPSDGNGTPGVNSVFSSITAAGGGGGGGHCSPTSGTNSPVALPGTQPGFASGLSGGSGGGGRGTQSNPGSPQPANHYFNPGGVANSGGTGNTPPVSPPQGQPGGSGYDGVTTNSNGGGGGGAIGEGNDARGPGQGTNAGGPGGAGAGIPTAFGANGQPCGSFRYYAGGGGGGQDSTPGSTPTGGLGGGGNGAATPGSGTAGTANTGGGGGAGSNAPSGAGGSGIVIIRYKFQ